MAIASSGCIISSGNDEVGSISVQFQLLQLDSINGQNRVTSVAPCADGELLELEIINSAGVPIITEPFDCASTGILDSDPLSPDTYTVRVKLIHESESQARSRSVGQQIEVTNGPVTLQTTETVPTNAGYVEVSWGFTDGATEISCAQLQDNVSLTVAPDKMYFVSTLDSNTPDSFDGAACDAGYMLTNLIGAGQKGDSSMRLYDAVVPEANPSLGPSDDLVVGAGWEIGAGEVETIEGGAQNSNIFIFDSISFCDNAQRDNAGLCPGEPPF